MKYFSSMVSKPFNIRWIRTGSQAYWKSWIASYYRQFSANIKLTKNIMDTSFVSSGLWTLWANKTGFNLLILIFYIRGKLSIIRWDAKTIILSAHLKDLSYYFIIMAIKTLWWIVFSTSRVHRVILYRTSGYALRGL